MAPCTIQSAAKVCPRLWNLWTSALPAVIHTIGDAMRRSLPALAPV
jgi:hypothetical protein